MPRFVPRSTERFVAQLKEKAASHSRLDPV